MYDVIQASNPNIRPIMDKLRLPVKRIILPSVPGICHNSDRIYYLLWNSEMHGMVLLGFRRLLQSGWSRPGRALVAHRTCKEMFLQKSSESMMGIESMTSSIQWAPHCPFRKRHGWILCWTPSSPSQGLLEYKFLFESILIRPISFVFISVRASFPLRWVSASASEVASTSFLNVRSTSMACFVSSRTLALLSQVARCFQMDGTSSSRAGCCGCYCCCCCVCQLLFNVTLGAGLGIASLSKITRSPFWEVTRSMQSPGTVV